MKRRKILWLSVLCCLALVLAVAALVTTQTTRQTAEPSAAIAAAPSAAPTPEASASGVLESAAPTPSQTPEPSAAPVQTASPTPDAATGPTAAPTPAATPKPTPAPTPTPAPPQTVTLMIECHTALASAELSDAVRAVLPPDGVILREVTAELEPGDTVWTVLQRVCRDEGVALEASWTPAYHTAYVQGIGQLYEFDCGQGSGWIYSVNGVVPDVGCSGYTLRADDVIRWMYTCDYGHDVGGRR